MPERSSTEWHLRRWAGTTAQLAEAARIAAARVTALAPYPEDYDPDAPGSFGAEKRRVWDAAKTAERLEITVDEQDGYSSQLTSIDELENLPERSLHSITTIAVSVGGRPYSPPAVQIRFRRESGLSVDVHGYGRAWTAGVRHELEPVLEPEPRVQASIVASSARSWLTGTAVYLVSLVGMFLAAAERFEDLSTATTAAMSFVISYATLALTVVVLWLLGEWAPCELLREGERPRYQRWRKAVLGGLAAIVLSVIAAAIFGLVS